MKRIFILLFLLPLLTKAQVYQSMPQAGYGAVKRMLFDSVLTLPLGITKLQNITGGRDTGQIRYNKADSSIYTYSGNGWRKVSGGGSTDTTSLSNRINTKLNISDTASMLSKYLRKADTASLSNRINKSLQLLGGTMIGDIISGVPDEDNGSLFSKYLIKTTSLIIANNTSDLALSANSYYGDHANFGYGNVIINNNGKVTSVDTLIGKAIKRTGGLSSEYLMANGSVSTIGTGLSLSNGVLSNTATPTPLGYYGAFQDNTTQNAAAINTPYAMKFGITDLSNAVTIVSDGSNLTRITIANTGIYNIQFSAQFDRTNSGTDVVDIWLRKNGVDVAGSGGKIVLTGSSTASQMIAAWNYVIDVTAGDYYQLMWSTPDTHVRILSEAAQTSPFAHPIIPSTILTVTQQSGIMAGTGITAINSLTGAAQTMVTGTDSSDFKIVSTGTQHKFNIPTASSTKRGALSSADWTTFNGKMNYSDTASLSSRINTKQNIITNPITGTGTASYLPKFTSSSTIGNSLIYDNGTNVLVNTITDDATGNKLQVSGGISASTFSATAGTASVAPVKLTAGTNLTSAAAGAMEYDATNNLLAFTSNTTLGRGIIPNFNSFLLRANGSAITTIDNFFGATSNIPVTAGYYEIEVEMFFLKTTASTIVWTFAASGGFGSAYDYIQSPAAGIPLTVPNANYLKLSQPYTSGASFTLTTASLTTAVNHYAKFKIFASFPGTTALTIKVTSTSGSVTPLQMSNWKATKLPSTNIGTYAP
jgi:hypothetical protein